MNNPFLDKPGYQLKRFASAIFWIITIGGIIVSSIIFGRLDFGVIILSFICFSITGWLLSIVMYAFGDLCERAEHIDKLLTEAQKRETQRIEEEKAALQAKEMEEKKREIEKKEKERWEKWNCPKCHTDNPTSITVCKTCGYDRYGYKKQQLTESED